MNLKNYSMMGLESLKGQLDGYLQKEVIQEIEERKNKIPNQLREIIYLVKKDYESNGKDLAVKNLLNLTGLGLAWAEATVASWADVFRWKNPKRLDSQMDMERIMRRAKTAIIAGMPEEDLVINLSQEESLDERQAFYIVKAAEVLALDEELGRR